MTQGNQTESARNRPRISLVIPAFNEVSVIGTTIRDAIAYFESHRCTFEIIVSADGNDGTREAVHEMGRSNPRIQCIGGLQRRGKGFAVRDAVGLARGQIIGYVDADNKTPLAELDKFMPYLDQGIEVVIGSRFLAEPPMKVNRPLYRRLGSMAFHKVTEMMVGLSDVPDTQCGFKFFLHDAAKKLFGKQRVAGYTFDVEILYLARKFGYRIQQVQVAFRYDMDSRMSLVMGNLRSFLDVMRLPFLHRND